MRKKRWLPRVLWLVFMGVLIAVAIFGFFYIRDRLTTTAPAAPASAQDDTDETMQTLVNGAYQLRIVTRQVSGGNYTSFQVYWLRDGVSELWYTCGRMFPTDEVASIAWANGNYDIEVRLKDGKTVTFSYNGNNEWT